MRAELVLEQELARRLARRQLERYRPYKKQIEFHAAGLIDGVRERALIAGNQLGKTWSASMEVAAHLTGRYPANWKGMRFNRPNHWLAGSESGELTRRGVQRLLMGRDLDENIGTGAIPHECIIGRPTMARGVPDLVDTAQVRHVTGGVSSVSLKSYDQGRSKWQADTVDGIWFDEEPPSDVYTEGLTRTNLTMGPILLTLTPLKGMSEVVMRFLKKHAGTHTTMMTIEDAEHYRPEQRAAIIASYPEHERDARTKGIPMMGSGRVFPIAEERLAWESHALPDHWPRICGIDFGWDHPTAAAWLAWDRDSDTVYLYDAHRLPNAVPAIHASSIKARGAWIPVAWPADGLQTEKGTGFQLAEQYRNEGVNMLPEYATLPETPADKETQVSRTSVEAGVILMLSAMEQSRFKVAKHLNDFWEEFRLYHRKDGKIVKERDDLISAVRYAYVMRRFADTNTEYTPMNLNNARDWRS